jgi:hypothetical protein
MAIPSSGLESSAWLTNPTMIRTLRLTKSFRHSRAGSQTVWFTAFLKATDTQASAIAELGVQGPLGSYHEQRRIL